MKKMIICSMLMLWSSACLDSHVVARSDSDLDTDSDIEADTDSDTDTDTDTDTDDDTDSGPDPYYFRDDFNGSTVFTESAYPFGEGSPADNDAVVFWNNGTEHMIILGSFDEAELSVSLDMPFGDYLITVAWRTEEDYSSYADACGSTQLDDHYGNNCEIPNRSIVINGDVIHEITGQLTYYSENTVVQYSGAIDTFKLACNSCSSPTTWGYKTYYDYVEIDLE